jgi:hypothetical protein
MEPLALTLVPMDVPMDVLLDVLLLVQKVVLLLARENVKIIKMVLKQNQMDVMIMLVVQKKLPVDYLQLVK